RAARLLGADSRFGAQLDSLADLVSFGVAPSIIMYMWSLKTMGNAGWIAALIFCACGAIRLARFNVESVRDEGATKGNPYFTGLPTPSIKYMKLQRQHRGLAVVCFAGLAALLIAWPWATMTIGLLIYVASIPFAIFAHHPRYATRSSA